MTFRSFLAGAVLMMAAGWLTPACSQGMDSIQPTPMFQTEGRDPIVLTATCTSSAWTLVISSDTAARSTLIVAVSSNTSQVCLYPTSAGGTSANPGSTLPCAQYVGGTELTPNSALTDYSRGAWWCRVPVGIGNQNLKGYRTRDRADQGQVSAPYLQ